MRAVALDDTVGDRLVDAGAEEAYERAARRLALTSLLPRIASLSGREQTILRGRYGLDGPVQTLRGLRSRPAHQCRTRAPARATGARHAPCRRHAPRLKLVRRPPAGGAARRTAEHGRGPVALMAGR